jgi:hypothetical protein
MNIQNDKPTPQEKDFLVYSGNSVPRFLRLMWTFLIVFCIVYCLRYATPDLIEWIKRVK